MEQLSFKYKESLLQLLSVDEIYHKADGRMLVELKEDRRIERKPAKIHARELGEYFSMWANTAPDGGIMALGVENDGAFSGCALLSPK
jgi:ATP-dependent DNA helicase RecG